MVSQISHVRKIKHVVYTVTNAWRRLGRFPANGAGDMYIALLHRMKSPVPLFLPLLRGVVWETGRRVCSARVSLHLARNERLRHLHLAGDHRLQHAGLVRVRIFAREVGTIVSRDACLCVPCGVVPRACGLLVLTCFCVLLRITLFFSSTRSMKHVRYPTRSR